MLHHPRIEPTIHPSWCTCSDCRSSHVRFGEGARLRAWAILFIGIAGALYGTVFAYAPQIAAALGFTL